jgi:hypothetical protein
MELFPLFGAKSGRLHFRCALDDEKGSDRALAPGKGMPFSDAFFRKNMNFPGNSKIYQENRIPQRIFPFCKMKS